MRKTTQAAAVLAAFAAIAAPARGGDEGVRYNRDVRPVLADACFRCHGPSVKKAGLRLDLRDSALKPTDSGATPLVPGKPDDSEVVRRVFSDDPDEVMPPPSSKKTLTADQKAVLKRWVESGAEYEAHWSFQAPVRPAVPKVEGPSFRVVNPVDAFLAQRLKREGLTTSPEADRPTLIRRAAFALTGLPPTPQEVDLFLADTSSRAYENMVERYLYSPRFGEEMARHWLDVARYADTHGLHLDNERQMWLYRDWVVRAFNDGMPFDRFTTEQLAGDLLPDPTPDQLVATGFNRNNVTTGEGGSIESEWYFRNAVDRAATAAEAWLGLTAGCAVCHDHKYDPLPADDFYGLYAFFYSADGPALDGNVALHAPSVKVPTPEQSAKLAALDAKLAEARKALDGAERSLAYADPADGAAAGSGSGAEPDPKAGEPAHSFRAWSAKGGPALPNDAPEEVKKQLTAFRNGKPAADAEKSLRAYYLAQVCESTKGTLKPLADEVARVSKERADLDAAVPGSAVFREAPKPRDAFVMVRGQYDKTGKPVVPSTPKALPPLTPTGPGGRASRLDLARWLVTPEQPLTARVTVNRLWQQFFGTGLVKTSFDFGSQGDPPSHPDLLDWLAVEFREGGWDVRSVVRLLVNSAAFRRSSRVTPELLKRDPENRLYARGPRFRLDAEQVRDNALAVSGLINLQMGGRGVRPYQPPNIWEPVAFTGSNTRSYVADKGPALYRRSLYVFLKRTAPPPFMANFDAPSREFFCARRDRSNTPLQALQLLNDVQHVEAARALAERTVVEGGFTTDDRLTWAFRAVLSRRPEPDELAVLRREYEAERARFASDPASASKLVRVGDSPPRPGLPEPEVAAFALVANTLLNLDETLTRN